MKHLVIIGAGPRGLAVALRASRHKDLKVTVVDNSPISTWTFPNMLPDIQMRSPITFDLTTFYPELKDYSLSSFLGYKIEAHTQRQIEDSTIYCSRLDFVKYLKFIISQLKKEGVCFAKHNICTINTNKIMCGDGVAINYDYLVMATGRKTQEAKLPIYLKNKVVTTMETLHDNPWNQVTVNVVGSGQQSAELVDFLCRQKARVTWIQKHEPRVTQYPIPSMKEWGLRSALGNFYATRKYANKPKYLKEVKEWGPTITPFIANKLEGLKYKVLLNPSSTNEINLDSKFILATGFNQRIELLNLDFDIDVNPIDAYLPDIKKDFASVSHPNIYFTGLLALKYDGPRQGSIISSALTAHTIVNNILN